MSRAPRGFLETLLANCRPQPAIPAVLVLLLTLMLAMASAGTVEAGLLVTWGIPVGVLIACGLAVASGFCSFFPPLIWIALAWFGLGSVSRTPAATAGSFAVYAGTFAAVAMLVLQAWRVHTGRFKPTIGAVDPATR